MVSRWEPEAPEGGLAIRLKGGFPWRAGSTAGEGIYGLLRGFWRPRRKSVPKDAATHDATRGSEPPDGTAVFDIQANLIQNRFVRESFRGNAEERQGVMLCPPRPTPAILRPGYSDRETGVEVIKALSMP